MKIERAIEILDPEHRENYDGMDEVNEACRMGMEALERMRKKMQIEEIVDKFEGKLTDEEAFYLWDRWRRAVRYDAAAEWRESFWPFLEHAVANGFQLGMSVLRFDSALPFSPSNCFFGKGRADNKSRAAKEKDDRAEFQRMAERWDKTVYEPKRALVQDYKRKHGILLDTPKPIVGNHSADSTGCKWYYEEVCTNASCPVCADFCPVVDFPGVCRFEESESDQEPT